MKQIKMLLILLSLLCLNRDVIILAKMCSRYPSHTIAPKSPVDENYAILVQGNPQTYILGAEYRISLEASNGARFISFLLALENDDGDMTYIEDVGSFEIVDDVETQYSPNCYNMVESTNTNTKTHIEVKWIAPMEPGKGCILIRATVLHSRDIWYMDDGGLTRRICEEVVDDVESSGISTEMSTCCACDEASYDILFEGLWSRNLHPKDFPAQGFLTRFSDIIGASHASDYRFWEYGKLANAGMKEFAEYGSLRTLQKEFNYYFRNGKIRTIVRARGPAFPNLNSLSVSTVRVDPNHHLLSLASKIDPSPDWIVGISGFELCLSNCTWLLEKTISLYPWDIGTDAGPSYLSSDQPQLPPDVIRRIRHDFPNDPRYPFFDESGTPMKPLATLTVKRKRLYERDCEETENKDLPKECSTHPFNGWSECSVRCGQGIQWRRRVYKHPEVAKIYGCDSLTRNYLERTCIGENCEERKQNDQDDNLRETLSETDCHLSSWTAWSECSKTCGEGKMMKRRQYINPENEEHCQSQNTRKLLQYKKCIGRKCLGKTFTTSDEMNDSMENLENDNFEAKPNRNIFEEENQPIWSRKSAFDTKPSRNMLVEDKQPIWPHKHHFEQTEDIKLSQDNRYPTQNQIENEQVEDTYDNNEVNSNMNFNEPDPYDSTNGNNMRNNNVENEEVERINEEQEEYSQPPSSALDMYPTDKGNKRIVDCCFEPLKVYRCADSQVVGNFWTYNYCEDECMLYASNNCDRNRNKFKSLEDCEANCRIIQNNNLLQEKQQEECGNTASNYRRKIPYFK